MGYFKSALVAAGAVVVASALLTGEPRAGQPSPATVPGNVPVARVQPVRAVMPPPAYRDPHYVLLKLKGERVKWGLPRAGTGGVVHYAFVTRETPREGAINCRALVPVGTRLPHARTGAADFTAGLRRAMDAWSAAANVRFVQVDDPASAQLLIGGQKEPHGIAFTDIERDPTAPGPVASIVRAAICFNLNLPWEARMDGDPATPDIAYVAAHELGHVIGLDHAWGRDKIMRFQYEELFDTPQPDDLAGAIALYGPAQPLAPQIAVVPAAQIH